MPQSTDIERLLAIDTLLIKASGMDTEAVFMNHERRLHAVVGTKFRHLAEVGVKAAVRVAVRGMPPGTGTLGGMVLGAKVVRALRSELEPWAEAIEPALTAVCRQAYIEGKRQMLLRAHGKLKPLASQVLRKGPTFRIEPDFTLVDQKALEQLVEGQLHWVGEFYDEQLANEIDSLVRTTMVESGLGRAEAGKLLEAALKAKLGLDAAAIPAGWTGTTGKYFELIAANSVGNARVRGSLGQMRQIKVTRYSITAVGDERSCSRCKFMDGRSFEMKLASETMDAIAEASSPEEVKRVHPWAKSVDQMKNAPDNFPFPPFHGRCRCTVDISDDAELTFDED